MTESRTQRRINAAGNVAAGGALLGAAGGLNQLLEHDLRRSGRPKVVRAARERSLGAVHARRMAGKVGVFGMRSAGIPLLAYGGYNLVKPDRRVKRVSVANDMVKPVVRGTTLRAAADKRDVGKRDLSNTERRNLLDRKDLGRKLSLASGTMGLTALGLRSPQAAGVLVRRVKGAKRVTPLVHLANQSDRATRASNTLGVLAIGTGSIGSFNYASQQKLERKQQELASKSLVNPPGVVRKDKFLRQYSQNISPKAEEGYEHLKGLRSRERGLAAGNTVVGTLVGAQAARNIRARGSKLGSAVGVTWAGLSAMQARYNAQNARSMTGRMNKIKAKAQERAAAGELGPDRVGKSEMSDLRHQRNIESAHVIGGGTLTGLSAALGAAGARKPRNKLQTAAYGVGTVMGALEVKESARSIRRIERRMKRLEAQKPVNKALLRVPKINYTRRIGAGLTIRRPRSGGVRRNPSGSYSTFRGSVK